jgi:hypothetical protein
VNEKMMAKLFVYIPVVDGSGFGIDIKFESSCSQSGQRYIAVARQNFEKSQQNRGNTCCGALKLAVCYRLST